MTDREHVVARLKKQIKNAHNENSDFVHVTVGTAKMIVEMLEEKEDNPNGNTENDVHGPRG